MKISGSESTRAGQVSTVGSTPVSPVSGVSSSGSGPAASIELSAQAQAVSTARTEAASYVPAVNSVPDRDDMVASLRASISAGTYQVSSQDIASQMIRRTQADSLT